MFFKKKMISSGIVIVLAAALIYSLCAAAAFHISAVNIVKFVLAQVFVIYLPGNAISHRLFKGEYSFINTIFLSYAVGYGISILEYFIIWGLHIQQAAPIIIAVVSAICCVELFCRKDSAAVSGQKTDWGVLFVFCLYLLLCFLLYAGSNVSPLGNVSGITEINRDLQYWCSNSVALKNGFPPEASYFAGTRLYYHYFSCAHIALLGKVTGISIFELAFPLYPLGKCILMIGGVSFLLTRLGAGKYKLFYLCFFLLTTGFEEQSVITYVWHTVNGPFGFDIGFSYAVWFTVFFLEQAGKEKFDIRYFFISLLFWACLAGAKQPVSLVILMIPGLVCLRQLIQKQYKKAFLYGISILCIFLVIGVHCTGMFRFLTGEYEYRDNLTLNVMQVRDIEALQLVHSPFVIVNVFLTFIKKIYYANPGWFLLSVMNLILWIRYRRKSETRENLYYIAVMCAAAIFGLILWFIFDAGGASEMYFAIAAVIPCLLFNIQICKEVMAELKCKKVWAAGIVNSLSVCFLLIGLYAFAFKLYGKPLAEYVAEGVDKMKGTWSYSGYAFDRDEALAAEWLRENSDENSVIVSDRECQGNKINSYYYAIFSERQQYMEAADIIQYLRLDDKYNSSIAEERDRRKSLLSELYASDMNALATLKAEGVSYIIQDNRYSPNFRFDESLITKKFSSGHVTVYQIL